MPEVKCLRYFLRSGTLDRGKMPSAMGSRKETRNNSCSVAIAELFMNQASDRVFASLTRFARADPGSSGTLSRLWLVNNRTEGNAPLTVEALVEMLRG